MHDHAANAAIAHEQVRAAAHDEERRFSPTAKPDEFGKCFLRSRLDPELRRAADAHRGVFRERLVKLDLALRPDDLLQLFRDDQFSRELGQLLVDVAGAEADDDIAVRRARGRRRQRNLFESRLIETRAVACREIASTIVWPLTPGNAALAGG